VRISGFEVVYPPMEGWFFGVGFYGVFFDYLAKKRGVGVVFEPGLF